MGEHLSGKGTHRGPLEGPLRAYFEPKKAKKGQKLDFFGFKQRILINWVKLILKMLSRDLRNIFLGTDTPGAPSKGPLIAKNLQKNGIPQFKHKISINWAENDEHKFEEYLSGNKNLWGPL